MLRRDLVVSLDARFFYFRLINCTYDGIIRVFYCSSFPKAMHANVTPTCKVADCAYFIGSCSGDAERRLPVALSQP